jgi:hypothetical protein
MYNEQIESLITAALTDGELNEKEKQILFKKAESLGIDLDEFEMILQSRLFDKQQSLHKQNVEKPIVAPKSDKLGDVKKCPSCGAIVQSFATKCSDCGTEFRNIEASHNITKFFDKLNEIELNRKENLFSSEKLESNLGCMTIFKWIMLYPVLVPYNLIIYFINKSKPSKWSTTDVQKEEMIMNFPVPNSKEDIIEFITLSISKIQTIGLIKMLNEEGKYLSKWNDIWKKKCEQIYNKAKFSMQEDKNTLKMLEEMLTAAKVLNPKK